MAPDTVSIRADCAVRTSWRSVGAASSAMRTLRLASWGIRSARTSVMRLPSNTTATCTGPYGVSVTLPSTVVGPDAGTVVVDVGRTGCAGRVGCVG